VIRIPQVNSPKTQANSIFTDISSRSPNKETEMNKIAQFNIGDLVIHKQHRYRAIIVDVDPLFQASGNYNPQALKREFATRNPWYRLLVDDSSQIAYVEECMLVADTSHLPINNPNIGFYLKKQGGQYRNANSTH
jgi:heat shock protein HspQ